MRPDIRNAIARVEVIEGGQPRSRGTGFLVSERWVLTALHVVADRKANPPQPIRGIITLQFPEMRTTATICEGCLDVRSDWVLLECGIGPGCIPLVLGHSESDGQQWETFGFPDSTPRDGMVHTGSIEHANHSLEGVTVLQLYSKQAAAGNGAPVEGFSGAPVIVGGVVVGLLRYALLKQKKGTAVAGTLYACPAKAVGRGATQLLVKSFEEARRVTVDRSDESRHVQVDGLGGAIRFALPNSREEKNDYGGRFWAELNVRLRIDADGSGSECRLGSVVMECMTQEGVRTATVKHEIYIVTSVGGELCHERQALIENDLLLNPVRVTDMVTLYVRSDYRARICVMAADWDFGYLRLIGYGMARDVIFDETFQYKGARTLVTAPPPEVNVLDELEIRRLLHTGYITKHESAVLLDTPPDERLLMYRRLDYEYHPAVRQIVTAIRDRLKNDAYSLSDRRPQFPPPFVGEIGNPREHSVKLEMGETRIQLPSHPLTSDSVWLTLSGIAEHDFDVNDDVIEFSPAYTHGLVAHIVYVEDNTSDA